jgi:arginine-tRNA-protein transferase
MAHFSYPIARPRSLPLTPTGAVLARAFSRGLSPTSACPYLRDQQQTLAVHHLLSVSPHELELLLSRGFRRFGFAYFRPVCACLACDSIRVPVATFRPSKSQKRAWKKASNLTITWGEPTVDDERIALYRAWHALRETTRGWGETDLDVASYVESFCMPHPCGREVSYRIDGRLVAVGIVDQASDGLSAVYCYYEPALAELSLGVVNVLACIERARELGLRHVYLGFRVEACPSLRYKASFRPYELLQGRPAEGEPTWTQQPDE